MAAAMSRWTRTIAQLGDVPVATMLGWVVRTLVWVAAGCGGVVAWYQVRQPDKPWPPTNLPDLIWQDFYWFVFFIAIALAAAADPSKLLIRRNNAVVDERIANYRIMGAQLLRKHLKPLKSCGTYTQAWETLLRAAELELEKELKISGSLLIQANLLLVKDGDASKVVVVARSKPGNCPVEHAHDPKLMASRAMLENRTVVQTHVRDVSGFEHKKYNCVAATPIADGRRALGAVTVDSKEPTTFKGREAVIDRVLRPYCGLFLLTIGKSATYHNCAECSVR